ncbi:hypothetical protein IWZ01DRAFT_370805 [Phyllosticta capitalensis]
MDFSPLEELLYYDFYDDTSYVWDDTSYVWDDTSYVWDDIKMVPKIQEPPALESITQFDNKGDIRLIVVEPPSEECPALWYTFIVSSKVMSLACDAWNTMLNGQFKEAQSTSGERKIDLPDDDPVALAILLNIAHLRFDLVPSPISFSLLLKVTVLTDKYDMTRVIRPWATSWIDGLGSQLSVTSPGYEEWLWIAWELGNKSKFECLTAHLVKTTRLGKDGKCTTQSGKILDPCGSFQHFPPDIIESIMEVRRKAISDLLDVYYSALDNFVEKQMAGLFVCQGRGEDGARKQCDELAFGSLCLALRKAGLGLERVPASNITQSVDELLVSLKNTSVSSSHRPSNYSRSDEPCSNYKLNTTLGEAAQKAQRSAPSPVTEVHHNHLARQAQKLGL